MVSIPFDGPGRISFNPRIVTLSGDPEKQQRDTLEVRVRAHGSALPRPRLWPNLGCPLWPFTLKFTMAVLADLESEGQATNTRRFELQITMRTSARPFTQC